MRTGAKKRKVTKSNITLGLDEEEDHPQTGEREALAYPCGRHSEFGIV